MILYIKKPAKPIYFGFKQVTPYSCEYCGDHHRTRCDICSMPPCRCLC